MILEEALKILRDGGCITRGGWSNIHLRIINGVVTVISKEWIQPMGPNQEKAHLGYVIRNNRERGMISITSLVKNDWMQFIPDYDLSEVLIIG